MLPVPGKCSLRAFSGKPCLAGQPVIATKSSLSRHPRTGSLCSKKIASRFAPPGLAKQVTGGGFLTENRARSDRLARLRKHHLRHRIGHSGCERRFSENISRQTKKGEDRVNNSWLWIRAKRSGGEGVWGYQGDEGCTDGELASNLFQHRGLSWYANVHCREATLRRLQTPRLSLAMLLTRNKVSCC
jgi:hypothetical protein